MDGRPKVGSEALELMQRALDLLDNSDIPADVGAHLDLAIERLKQHLNGIAQSL